MSCGFERDSGGVFFCFCFGGVCVCDVREQVRVRSEEL